MKSWKSRIAKLECKGVCKRCRLPLRFHMIKALNKVKKAGAVAQERAKFSTNNM